MGVRLGACRRERASGRGMEASRRARVFDGALAACAADVGVVPWCENCSFVTHALSFTALEMTRARAIWRHSQNAEDHRCDRRRSRCVSEITRWSRLGASEAGSAQLWRAPSYASSTRAL